MSNPLIPEIYLDVPSQRLYCLSLGLLFQAIKLFDFFQYLWSTQSTTSYGKKWLFVDFLYVAILAQLRIPRLNYRKAVVILQIVSLWFLDGLLFGGITLNMAYGISSRSNPSVGDYNRLDIPSTHEPFQLSNILSSIGLTFLSVTSYSGKDRHLLGQHTIRMSPISTAHLNPNGETFCLPSPGTSVLIPILLNNTDLSTVKYSLIPLGYTGDREQSKLMGKVERRELNSRELKAIEKSRMDNSQLTRSSPSISDIDEYDEYDDDRGEGGDSGVQALLQRSQSLQHIRLNKPGTLRLDRVVDTSETDARIAYPDEVTVVPCPQVEFVEDKVTSLEQHVYCARRDRQLHLMISINGVPPLSLRWYKEVDGKREHFLVEGIEGPHHDHHHTMLEPDGNREKRRKDLPQSLKVPLTVSLDALGTHLYVLEEVVDGLGNVVGVVPEVHAMTSSHGDSSNTHVANPKIVRSAAVLRRPTFSFKHCGPGNPTPLLIGSEAPLIVSGNEADPLDGPWEVTMKYVPPSPADDYSNVRGKGSKPWQRTAKTDKQKELVVRADAPGEYTIIGVKGKWCEGDVLAPETCQVVEKPIPTAEIEWKRIHECSGDTGVSASLVLHGTPPFQVYYRTQRDKEPEKEGVKTFANSRGEITLQPSWSGHYVYTFLQLSDANYKRVELNGPTIDQVVHPLASAEFAYAKTKKMISSCSGNIIDVDVHLRGTGPWNLQIQITGPKITETLRITGLSKEKTTFQVPIPQPIDRNGGSFEVDIVDIEDAYGCKRSISVPSISVNVRRVKPTVRFYGKASQRQVTVLEGEAANLPLRLTGDGPWRVSYRKTDTQDLVLAATLKTPNDHLRVWDAGLFEITEVMDSQCPGEVIADSATYRVDWVPRPSARLSQTEMTYEPYNNSHILPPICQGADDHVDLDLTGRPPFQIMYNIAKNSETGSATRLLDQPTFNSIQPRTRFQLHTSTSGRMYYEVKQIGDAAYPLAKHNTAVIPPAERLLFEQEVVTRPSARFKTNLRLPYCLYDHLTPKELGTSDGTIILEGAPPFILELSIKDLASSNVVRKAIEVFDRTWKIDLPSYIFRSIGPHLVTIESVEDSSHCEQETLDPLTRSIWIEVKEAAAIYPFDRRADVCVGDVSQFQLEGTPPWTISYRMNGKFRSETASTSPFGILHQQPGEFTISSIAHQQKMCKATVTDLRLTVHPLPAAQVAHGKGVYQDIHEGDQAKIVFTLIGVPPFTFTYQRSEPIQKKGTLPGRVLETHTVSGVTVNEYSIYAALEGTWTVTSISDRYCRYPPAQQDGSVKRLRN